MTALVVLLLLAAFGAAFWNWWGDAAARHHVGPHGGHHAVQECLAELGANPVAAGEVFDVISRRPELPLRYPTVSVVREWCATGNVDRVQAAMPKFGDRDLEQMLGCQLPLAGRPYFYEFDAGVEDGRRFVRGTAADAADCDGEFAAWVTTLHLDDAGGAELSFRGEYPLTAW